MANSKVISSSSNFISLCFLAVNSSILEQDKAIHFCRHLLSSKLGEYIISQPTLIPKPPPSPSLLIINCTTDFVCGCVVSLMKSNKELKGCTKWNKRFVNATKKKKKGCKLLQLLALKKRGLKKKEDKKSKYGSITCIY
jgi:hypothetical protein